MNSHPHLTAALKNALEHLTNISRDNPYIGSDGYESFDDLAEKKLYEAYNDLLDYVPKYSVENAELAEHLIDAGNRMKHLHRMFLKNQFSVEEVEELVDDLHHELSALL
jgi:DNA repair ATPase RecN